MKYVFRLTVEVKALLDLAAPPSSHKRSGFIRTALTAFLRKEKQPLFDRPHLRGRVKVYEEICAILREDQIEAIKQVYPEISVAIVIQAAVSSELRKIKYKNKIAASAAQPAERKGNEHRIQNTDDHEGSDSSKRDAQASGG